MALAEEGYGLLVIADLMRYGVAIFPPPSRWTKNLSGLKGYGLSWAWVMGLLTVSLTSHQESMTGGKIIISGQTFLTCYIF